MPLSTALFILAQTTTPTVTPVLEADVPVCMSRPVTDDRRSDLEFRVVVTSLLSKDLLAKGFTVIPCTASRLTASSYRQTVCSLADGNAAVQARLEDVLGVQPKLLCQSAASLGAAVERALSASN